MGLGSLLSKLAGRSNGAARQGFPSYTELRQLGLALGDARLIDEARACLTALRAEASLHALSNAVASEEPTFSDEV